MSQLISYEKDTTGTVTTITGDVGGAISPAAGNINILGGTNINTSGAGSTITINLDDPVTLTQLNATNITVSGLGRGVVQSDATGVFSSSEGIDGQILVSSGAGAPIWANITSSAGRLDVTNGANTIDIDTFTVLQSDTGFATWTGAGNYYDDTTLGDFELLRGGTGFIKGVPVTWAGAQTVTGLTSGNAYYIYVDDTGTIGKTDTRTNALYSDYIVLFQCWRDAHLPANNQKTVKENHPYDFPVHTSNYLHNTVGSVIENYQGGANITLNGTQKIEISGADELDDHGLETDIPDSGGVAEIFAHLYTDAAGKWAVNAATDTFPGEYNNAGTVTALGANKYGVYALYVGKDDLNTVTPRYGAILNSAQYNNLAGAKLAISTGDVSVSTNELSVMENCRLGYIIFEESSTSIVEVIIDKNTLRSVSSTSGTNQASLINTNVTNFDGILSAADTNVQASLETIDDWGKTTTDHSLLLGNGTGFAIGSLPVGDTNQIISGNTGADPSWSSDLYSTIVKPWFGSVLETPDVVVTSDGATITLSIEKDGGGDLIEVFSTGYYTWNCTPADTIVLTAGSDAVPQMNYIYFLESTKALTVSTVGWPHASMTAIATVLCQSAVSLQADGAYKVHVWADHLSRTDISGGHIKHINLWIRNQYATWSKGVDQTLTITAQGAAPDNVIFTSTAGAVFQLEVLSFPAFTGTPDIYTVNDPVATYNKITDLNALLTDSTGATMSGRYFSLVIWGVISQDTTDCKLMVNLPGGSYGTAAQLNTDAQKHADYSMPSDFKGTGFLIAQLNLRHQTVASGTWTEMDLIDIRGLFPTLTPGGSIPCETEFADSVFKIFDETDNTKELQFQVSGVATATTRTITMDDRDIDLDAVPDQFATDSGTATPAAGIATISGGANIATSGAGSTVTVDFDGILPIANGGTNANTMATTYGVNYFDGTKLVTTAVGTATHVLTSNGVGVAPTFQASAGGGSVNSVTGGTNINITGTAADPIVNLDNSISVSGTVTAATGMTITANDLTVTSGNLLLPLTSATVGQIKFDGDTIFHIYGAATDFNIFIGELAGNTTLTTGTAKYNFAFGYNSLNALTTGNRNVMSGTSAGTDITEGTYNVGIGNASLLNLTTGSFNSCFGAGSGNSLTLTDSDNVLIGYNVGTVGDNNTIRIGAQGSGDGQQDKCYIAGTYNVTPGSSTQETVIIDSNGQLGSTDKMVGVSTLNNQTGTTYTLVLADQNKLISCTNAATITLTVPPNSSVAFSIGTQISLYQGGAGMLSIAAGSGVTIRSADTLLDLYTQYSTASLTKILSDTWVLSGDLS